MDDQAHYEEWQRGLEQLQTTRGSVYEPAAAKLMASVCEELRRRKFKVEEIDPVIFSVEHQSLTAYPFEQQFVYKAVWEVIHKDLEVTEYINEHFRAILKNKLEGGQISEKDYDTALDRMSKTASMYGMFREPKFTLSLKEQNCECHEFTTINLTEDFISVCNEIITNIYVNTYLHNHERMRNEIGRPPEDEEEYQKWEEGTNHDK